VEKEKEKKWLQPIATVRRIYTGSAKPALQSGSGTGLTEDFKRINAE